MYNRDGPDSLEYLLRTIIRANTLDAVNAAHGVLAEYASAFTLMDILTVVVCCREAAIAHCALEYARKKIDSFFAQPGAQTLDHIRDMRECAEICAAAWSFCRLYARAEKPDLHLRDVSHAHAKRVIAQRSYIADVSVRQKYRELAHEYCDKIRDLLAPNY